jgi:DNA-binding MarR family transcriptional regulator
MKDFFENPDIQTKIWLNWYHTSGLIIKYADTKLSKIRGLSYQQFVVLLIMKRMGENANATEMAKKLDKNTNTLSTILDRMEEKGLVKKIRDTTDRRLVWAVMTEKGKEKLSATVKASWATFETLTSIFTPEEMKTFNGLLEKLSKNTIRAMNQGKRVKKQQLDKD